MVIDEAQCICAGLLRTRLLTNEARFEIRARCIWHCSPQLRQEQAII